MLDRSIAFTDPAATCLTFLLGILGWELHYLAGVRMSEPGYQLVSDPSDPYF